MVTRRRFVVAGAGALAASALAAPALATPAAIEAVDVLGNRVSLDAPPKRIVLLDATDIRALSALSPSALERVVGVASVARLDMGEKTGALTKGIPVVGNLSPESVSAEGVIGLKPDLVVSSAYMLPPDERAPLLTLLRSLGVPVAWTSGFDNALAPELALSRSMAFWGSVLGQAERAQRLSAFGQSRFDAVRACARAASDRPRVYMEIMSTFDDCCWAAGRAFWGDLFDMAGGALLAGSDGWGAKLSAEGLIALAPEVYIATGGGHAPGRQPAIGPGLDPEEGRRTLAQAAARVALQQTPAVRNGRVHGIWSGLVLSPILAPLLAERLGAWLHPRSCGALDSERTLQTLNGFFSEPLPGPLWLSLGES